MAVSRSLGGSLDDFCFLTFLEFLSEFWEGREDVAVIGGRIVLDEVFEVITGAATEMVVAKDSVDEDSATEFVRIGTKV